MDSSFLADSSLLLIICLFRLLLRPSWQTTSADAISFDCKFSLHSYKGSLIAFAVLCDALTGLLRDLCNQLAATEVTQMKL